MLIYTPIARRNIPSAVLAASVIASPVDTLLFLHLAGFPTTFSTVATQWLVKTLVALAASGFIVAYKKNYLQAQAVK
jgi:uncharacterized PurR-regulated membrane protein YhhQ (DUF165 family)